MPLFTNSTLVPPPRRRKPWEEEEWPQEMEGKGEPTPLSPLEEDVPPPSSSPPLLEAPPSIGARTEGLRIPSLEAPPPMATPRGAPRFSEGITLPPRPRGYDYEQTLAAPPPAKGWRKVLGTALEFSGLPRYGEMVKRPGYQEDLDRKKELAEQEESVQVQDERGRATRAREEETRAAREWREEQGREAQETRESRAATSQRQRLAAAAKYDLDSFLTEGDARAALTEHPDWYQPKIHKVADPVSGEEYLLFLSPKGQMATRGVPLNKADIQILGRNGIVLDPETTYLPAEAKAYHDHALALSRREGAMETTVQRGEDAMARTLKMIGGAYEKAIQVGDRSRATAVLTVKNTLAREERRIESDYNQSMDSLNMKRNQMEEEDYLYALNDLNKRHHASKQNNLNSNYEILSSLGEEWAREVPQIGPPAPVLPEEERKRAGKAAPKVEAQKGGERKAPAPAPSKAPPTQASASPPAPGSIQEEQQVLGGPHASSYTLAKGKFMAEGGLSEEQARRQALEWIRKRKR